MKYSTPKFVALAAVGLMGASAAANAHPQQQNRTVHSHKHTTQQSAVSVVAKLPLGALHVVFEGHNYYESNGSFFVKANRGWRRVAAPAGLKAVKAKNNYRRAARNNRPH